MVDLVLLVTNLDAFRLRAVWSVYLMIRCDLIRQEAKLGPADVVTP